MAKIPFNKTHSDELELRYIGEALKSGHLSGDGSFTKRCHKLLESEVGVKKALLTTSGTHALEMTALLLNLGPGDEVIVPSFTFVSSVNAFVLRGAKPVFADIRPDTLNIDEKAIERLVTKRTKAIMVVHYGGVACEMDSIMDIATRHKLAVIEDNAHGLFGKYKGKALGTFGALAALSFHETKNIGCGEGGALLLNDPQLIARAEVIREKGTDRSRYFRGEVDKYGWVDVGSSYLPSELTAAFLLAQLEKRATIQQGRQARWKRYEAELGSWAASMGIGLPRVPAECEQSYHLFYLRMRTLEQRDAFIAFMKSRDIYAAFHYQPLHASRMGNQYGYREGDLPITEKVAATLVRLPLYFDLTPAEQGQVIAAVQEWGATQSRLSQAA